MQRKFYSGPVGNGAVQETAAGLAHERTHLDAVVTKSRYTAPAEQLASTLKISADSKGCS
ncbi:MAG: restriction endonuclease [Bryobacteraceae bacterium]